MKKIAVLNCLKANDVCAGASCLKAFYGRSGGFADYGNEELVLTAFMRCSGCDADISDKGLKEKLDRLVEEGTQRVHIGVCTKDRQGNRCERILEMCAYLEDKGIVIVDRTH